MRVIRTGGLLVASVALATVAVGGVMAGPAFAKKPSFTCSTLNGSLDTDTATLSGCGGNTGGSGTFQPTAFETGSGTVSWTNGASTSFSISFKQLKKEKGCPSSAYSEYSAKGKTTADTTGSAPAGSKVKGYACVDISTGSLVNPAGKGFTI